ncbi:Nucleotide-binding universal stress protein, UspA family [Haloarcula vallismortis]|uniref:Universal stress protein n=2 Tax=Haloarcula vallismortis TaxID=28442 RepID=M0JTB4_HALVA|nr:universal stress protein [Haloarcula vallismortis]EMA11204.1 universal stress protein [Haloarcula vallismortis ATCC 29715]SDX25545.1 Nucleotide-binding universal stress protein, UspA family [Haloarcula vallismortis]
MYDHILLASDGTEASTNAESHAIALAAEHGADLHVLYVVDEDVYTAYSGDEYVDESEGPEHGLEETGQETLARIQADAEASGVDVTTTLKHGRPAESIIDTADEADVDLLVLGTKRRPAEYRSLLGSITDKVLRLSERPAVVVKTEVEE